MANTQLGSTQKMSYTITETLAGVAVSPTKGDSVSIVASDTNDLSIVPDATPVAGALASGFIVGNPASKGAANIFITETITLANGAKLPAVSNLVDVTVPAPPPPTADESTFVFGTPVAQ